MLQIPKKTNLPVLHFWFSESESGKGGLTKKLRFATRNVCSRNVLEEFCHRCDLGRDGVRAFVCVTTSRQKHETVF